MLATGTLLGDLYKLDVAETVTKLPKALTARRLDAWHRSLAHIHPASITKLSTDGSVKGVDITEATNESPDCEHCIIGKGCRRLFPHTPTSHTSHLLELVHSDANGPLEVPSLGGSRYFITFIDDCSKWTTAYMMKRNSESLDCFRHYRKMAETHTGAKLVTINTHHRTGSAKQEIKTLRTDNGGEYISVEFKSYWKSMGSFIKRQLPTLLGRTV